MGREEELIPRAGLSTDRGGTDDELCEGGFSRAFPPELRHDRSRTGAEVRHVRLDQLKLTSLADPDPAAAGAGRVSWRLATFYISYFYAYNTCLCVCFLRHRHCHWRGWD
jgi:hypothetical protein